MSPRLHVLGLLDEQALGVLEQDPFHEQQSAVILEAMDQNHVAAVKVVASLAPLQLFIEARCQAELAERSIFSTPALFLAMNLADEGIHMLEDHATPPGRTARIWRPTGIGIKSLPGLREPSASRWQTFRAALKTL